MTISKSSTLRELLNSSDLTFLLEVHNGLSAKIAEEAGFECLWGSGLSISASMGVRDNNELSWTQVLQILEFICDGTSVPLLFDGDTGYGNFNNVRRLIRKLEQIGVAGVSLEDKLFPKTNSFIVGECQPLADIDEFAGKIQAGKDAQTDPAFSIVARVEAFVAGWGLAEALKRADAYHRAGADAILIHSSNSRPDEVLAFKKEWGDRCPVVIVPTRYYSTHTDVFRKARFHAVIWANHLMRSCITAMQETARQVKSEMTLVNIEERVAPLAEVFRLQGSDELQEAEKRYLPTRREEFKAVILAASRGTELGPLTENRPKTMIPVSGQPLLYRITETFNQVGIKEITVVRGYKKEMISAPNLRCVDNDDYAATKEVYSLYLGIRSLTGSTLITYGDVLCSRHIPASLIELDATFCLAVDADWTQSRNRGRYTDFVACDRPYRKDDFERAAFFKSMSRSLAEHEIQGEWIGLFKVSAEGLAFLQQMLSAVEPRELRRMRMSDLFNRLTTEGKTIHVIYTWGNWLDVDELEDVSHASSFRRPPS